MFDYKWKIKDGYPAKGVEKHGSTVFSTFACGGGSTMGYKLAGYDVIGANDVDKEMAKIYKANHSPELYYLEDIRKFRKREDLPDQLYNLDVLDGSPPCSTFSTAGKREKDWGKKKKFREGQVEQTLDDLFFEYIALVNELQPKVSVAENVSGLVKGKAKGYVLEIIKRLDTAGYNTQVFLLNAATMGVPQRRQRVFFLSVRKDLDLPKIKLEYNLDDISVESVMKRIDDVNTKGSERTHEKAYEYWKQAKPGETFDKYNPKGNNFTHKKIETKRSSATLTASCYSDYWHYKSPRHLSKQEVSAIGSFPLDYDYKNLNYGYVVGMSVPPVMMAHIANDIYNQWISRI